MVIECKVSSKSECLDKMQDNGNGCAIGVAQLFEKTLGPNKHQV